MAKKRTKWSTNFFFPKEPYFWKKEHNFHPKTIFFYIYIHKFFWKCQNVAIFFGFYRWFLVFFKKFSKKVYFTVLQRSTKFFQRATRLWKSHQCATKRTLLNTLMNLIIFASNKFIRLARVWPRRRSEALKEADWGASASRHPQTSISDRLWFWNVNKFFFRGVRIKPKR